MICPSCAETIHSSGLIAHLNDVHPGTIISVRPIPGTDLVLIEMIIECVLETDEDILGEGRD